VLKGSKTTRTLSPGTHSPVLLPHSGFYCWSRPAGASALALCGSFLIHSLFVFALIGGLGRASKDAPDRVPPSALAGGNDGALQGIDLEGNDANETTAPFASVLTAANLTPIGLPTDFGEADAEFPLDADAHNPQTASASSLAGNSALYGFYVGQINARIERAWTRPRSAIGAPYFTCRMRIEQGVDGTVQSVTPEACNGDSRWQASLAMAIRGASPLPAPPDPSVFVRVLHLAFNAKPYSPGADGYEHESPTPAPLGAQSGPRSSAIRLRRSPDGVIDLRIVGPAAPQGSPVPSNPEAPLPAPEHQSN
jgi:hypothetical protein